MENYERQTQIFILTVCALMYGLSAWMVTSIYDLYPTTLITWLCTTFLLLIVIAHSTF